MADTRPRWESEMWTTQQPNAQACATCMLKQTEYNGIALNNANTVTCQIYESPETKPDDIYWDGADCEYYVEE